MTGLRDVSASPDTPAGQGSDWAGSFMTVHMNNGHTAAMLAGLRDRAAERFAAYGEPDARPDQQEWHRSFTETADLMAREARELEDRDAEDAQEDRDAADAEAQAG